MGEEPAQEGKARRRELNETVSMPDWLIRSHKMEKAKNNLFFPNILTHPLTIDLIYFIQVKEISRYTFGIVAISASWAVWDLVILSIAVKKVT